MSDNQSAKYLPLTTPQKWLMNETRDFKRRNWVTVENLVKPKLPMNVNAMRETVLHLMEKYESLRVKIISRDGQLVQQIQEITEIAPFEFHDFSRDSEEAGREKLKQACIATRDALLPENGNLIRFVLFRLAGGEERLWLCMHHMVSDFMTMYLLSNEFINTYNGLLKGKMPVKEVVYDFRKWLYTVEGYSRDVLVPSELDYWTSLPWSKAKILPSDFPDQYPDDQSMIDEFNTRNIATSFIPSCYFLPVEESMALFAKQGNELENTLIAVYFLALHEIMKIDWLDINVAYSGRDILPPDYQVKTNRLMGYIAGTRVVPLAMPQGYDKRSAIEHIIQQIRNVPNKGKGYYLLTDHLQDSSVAEALSSIRKEPGVLFNYLGRTDVKSSNDQFALVDEDTARGFHENEFSVSSLQCFIGVEHGKLFFGFTHCEKWHKAETIERVAQFMMDTLVEVILEREPITH
ncbi:MAG: condensation domain-containing protein [Bacteroidota bacterium]